MAFIYFLVITPIALILKIFAIDVTNQKKMIKMPIGLLKKIKLTT